MTVEAFESQEPYVNEVITRPTGMASSPSVTATPPTPSITQVPFASLYLIQHMAYKCFRPVSISQVTIDLAESDFDLLQIVLQDYLHRECNLLYPHHIHRYQHPPPTPLHMIQWIKAHQSCVCREHL